MRTRLVLALVAAVVLMVAAVAHGRTLGSGAATGRKATAVATGNINRPRLVSVRVRSSPRQRVTGQWAIVCTRGSKGASSHGRVRGRGRFTQTLRLPRGRARRGRCVASVTATLADRGSIRVALLGH